MTRILLTIFLVAAVLGTVQPASSQTFDDMTVRPGTGIGPVRLGLTLDQVRAALGRGPDSEAAQGDAKVYRWNLQGAMYMGLTQAPALWVEIGASNGVDVVGTTATGFVTPGGSSLGLSINGFKEEFGQKYRGFKDNTGVRHLRFDTVGIAVTYDIRAAGLTTTKSLMVFKPAAEMPGPPPTIVPGERIGPVRLGVTVDEAIQAMGRAPKERSRGPAGEFMYWVLAEKDPFDGEAWLVLTTDPQGRVFFITTDAVAHQTPQGNTPGISILELQAEFGAAFRTSGFGIPSLGISFMGIWYDQFGITGLYLPADPEKRILNIGVFRR